MSQNEPVVEREQWPELSYSAWRDTCATLHLWTQIVGKIRLALTPWVNHSWHSTLYVTVRGLGTSPIPYGDRSFSIDFDFIDHHLVISDSRGALRRIALRPRSVADFYAVVMAALQGIGIRVAIHKTPNEIPNAIPFDQDQKHRAYDADYAHRFWQVLLLSDRVMAQFRTGFLGKVSPVHFFWGSFDLAVTRFSGRRAPLHPGGVANLPDAVVREAYSHEVSSAGFWPGNDSAPEAAYYSYAYPEPAGYRTARIEPAAAAYNAALGEFILPYDAVRTAGDPRATLLAFLQTTYAAAADAGQWDRESLECTLGQPGVPRSV
ncbi:DUF5996 family protein [Limobrevibacterium gyesilva]|uniref:DUF5996 family protein n=1 Tax=Limobrevibacterium gyesilva TaxID=2991712 RepID=A0AA41YUC7_9PROT|nr:DUF5996 family protein [Limobrevibacterium gyesilva]MCW3476650.1 DUF5996 family protein [Limobrevibacterium gyesilva]